MAKKHEPDSRGPAAHPPAADQPAASAQTDRVAEIVRLADAKPPALGPERVSPPATKRFTVRTPHFGFTGERPGIRFVDGFGETDDKGTAEQCLSFGYEVTDQESGKVFNPIKRA